MSLWVFLFSSLTSDNRFLIQFSHGWIVGSWYHEPTHGSSWINQFCPNACTSDLLAIRHMVGCFAQSGASCSCVWATARISVTDRGRERKKQVSSVNLTLLPNIILLFEGSAVPCHGSAGVHWNWLCLAWGSPGLFSQKPTLQPPLPSPGHLHSI